MMSKRKRYWRLEEIASILFNGQCTRGAVHIRSARNSGWNIITGHKGYTLRPTAGDYLYHTKLVCRHAKGEIANVLPIIASCTPAVSLEMKKIVDNTHSTMLLTHQEE